jgi:hypothetical protein
MPLILLSSAPQMGSAPTSSSAMSRAAFAAVSLLCTQVTPGCIRSRAVAMPLISFIGPVISSLFMSTDAPSS